MSQNPLFEYQAKLLEAIRQRDSALERCQDLFAQGTLGGRRIAELEAQVAALQQELDTLKKIPTDSPPKEEA